MEPQPQPLSPPREENRGCHTGREGGGFFSKPFKTEKKCKWQAVFPCLSGMRGRKLLDLQEFGQQRHLCTKEKTYELRVKTQGDGKGIDGSGAKNVGEKRSRVGGCARAVG